jgi:hypothetical protein
MFKRRKKLGFPPPSEKNCPPIPARLPVAVMPAYTVWGAVQKLCSTIKYIQSIFFARRGAAASHSCINMRHIYFALSEMFTYDDQSKIVAARNRQNPGLWLL